MSIPRFEPMAPIIPEGEAEDARVKHYTMDNPPHGYEEALRKREAFPVDDPDQGPLLIHHLDKNGRSKVKQIVPKGEKILQLPDLYPRTGRKTLGQSEREGHDHQAHSLPAAPSKGVAD